MTADGVGYIFPEEIDPGDVYCFRVYVPKHQMYLGAFWGAYMFFSNWLAWARDPLKRGKDVARVWRSAIDRARAEFERTGGICTMAITGIRNDPLQPCVIQYQTDDGVWHDGADMSCCGGGGSDCVPPLRVGADGSIETTHDGGETWENTAPGVTPASPQNITPPYAGDPAGQCKAATGYYGYTKDFLERVLVAAGQTLTLGDFFLQVFDFLSLIFGFVIPAFEAISATLQVVYTSTSQVNEDRLAAKDDADFLCIFYRHVGPDGSITAAQVAALETDLRAWADDQTDESIQWWGVHAADMVNIWGVGGAQKAVSYQPETVETCDACEWEATLDFTKSAHGFVLWDRGTGEDDGAQYVAGQGFVTGSGGSQDHIVEALRLVPPTNFTGWDYTVVVERPSSGWDGVAVNFSGAGLGLDPLAGVCNGTQQWLTAGEHVSTCVITQTAQGVYFAAQEGFQGADVPGARTTFKKLVIRGTGFNPFAAESDE